MATNNCDNFTNPISVSTGGTSLQTLTAHSIQVGNGTSTITQLGVGATGTMLTGVTASDPAFSATPSVTSITFGAGTALSDYTEGTFTPTLDGSFSGTTTYTTQVGYYTTIGDLVFLHGQVTVTGATGTSQMRLGNFPFTIKNNTQGSQVSAILFDSSTWPWPTLSTSVTFRPTLNQTFGVFARQRNGAIDNNVQMANTAVNIVFSIMYLK